MSTDLFKSVIFNDGEGLTHTDLNDAQRYLSAKIYDQILACTAGGLTLTGHDYDFGLGLAPPNHLAYAISGGAAYLTTGSASNKIKITSGTLLQRVGTADGNNFVFLPYTFTGAEEFTIAAGDATHPRVDLLQMKLELVSGDTQSRDFEDATTHVVTTQSFAKKQFVQCTLSVKQGTPAASPAYPDPDSGYVAVGGVVVNANYTTGTAINLGTDVGGTGATLHDQRMPLGVRGHLVTNESFGLISGVSLGTFGLSIDTAPNSFVVACPRVGVGRVVGVDAAYGSATPPTAKLQMWSSALTDLNTLPFSTVGANQADSVSYVDIEGAHLPSAGPIVQPSATNKIGPPVWTTGQRCLRPRTFPSSHGSSSSVQFIAARFTGLDASTTFWPVHWYIAEGI